MDPEFLEPEAVETGQVAHAADVANVPAGEARPKDVHHVEVEGNVFQEAARDPFEIKIKRHIQEAVGIRAAVPAARAAERFQFQDGRDRQTIITQGIAKAVQVAKQAGAPEQRVGFVGQTLWCTGDGLTGF